MIIIGTNQNIHSVYVHNCVNIPTKRACFVGLPKGVGRTVQISIYTKDPMKNICASFRAISKFTGNIPV